MPYNPLGKDGEEALAIFGGQTRVLTSTQLSGRRNRKESLLTTENTLNLPVPDVHPSLVQLLPFFPQYDDSPITMSTAPAGGELQSFGGSVVGLDPKQHFIPQPGWKSSTPVATEFTGAGYDSILSGNNNFVLEPLGESSTFVGTNVEGSNQTDFGATAPEVPGISEYWMSFIRESGIIGESSWFPVC